MQIQEKFMNKCLLLLAFFVSISLSAVNAVKKNNNYGEEIVLFEYSNDQIAEESCQGIRKPYKRGPMVSPIRLYSVSVGLLYYAENGTIASIRVTKIEDESESVTYVTSGQQNEVFPLPASWREGDYVIVVTIGDRHYKGTFSL